MFFKTASVRFFEPGLSELLLVTDFFHILSQYFILNRHLQKKDFGSIWNQAQFK